MLPLKNISMNHPTIRKLNNLIPDKYISNNGHNTPNIINKE